MRTSPLLARLLLDWLAPGNEPLRGDLEEEFANGRSASWYWGQTLALIAREGTLRVRGRAIHKIENYVTGFITLTLFGFYAVFVVNVTDWLLRFEGFQVLTALPDAFGPINGFAPIHPRPGWRHRRARSAASDGRAAHTDGASMMLAGVLALALALQAAPPRPTIAEPAIAGVISALRAHQLDRSTTSASSRRNSKGSATASTRATPTSRSWSTPTNSGARTSCRSCAACSRWRFGTAAPRR